LLESSSEQFGSEQRLDPVGKYLQSARKMMAVRMEKRHRHGLSPMLSHDLDQFAR